MESTGGLLNPHVTIPIDSMNWRRLSLCRMSNASVDFPEPESPVRTTSLFLGISRVMFLRLCRRALRIVIVGFINSPNRHDLALCFISILQPWCSNGGFGEVKAEPLRLGVFILRFQSGFQHDFRCTYFFNESNHPLRQFFLFIQS